ncbi:hypothetical protein QBA54_07315 [Streptomyces sp. B21-108]|jgi:hypothetical protein|uniref:hypothetical protein n=1 Tax=Streptomyces sp. B21-108 TaxID=3039419 RepID=UPI002FEE68E8
MPGPFELANSLFRNCEPVTITLDGSTYYLTGLAVNQQLEATNLEDAKTETEAWMLANFTAVRVLALWLPLPTGAMSYFVYGA